MRRIRELDRRRHGRVRRQGARSSVDAPARHRRGSWRCAASGRRGDGVGDPAHASARHRLMPRLHRLRSAVGRMVDKPDRRGAREPERRAQDRGGRRDDGRDDAGEEVDEAAPARAPERSAYARRRRGATPAAHSRLDPKHDGRGVSPLGVGVERDFAADEHVQRRANVVVAARELDADLGPTTLTPAPLNPTPAPAR